MIIQSMIDNDLYKYSMIQAVLHQHPGAEVTYRFKCRTSHIDFRAYVNDIIKEVSKMCRELRFEKEELEYLGDLKFMKKDTIQFLKLFRYDYDFVHINADDNGNLHIIIKGPWLHTILFEVPILSIVSEIYSRDISEDFDEFKRRTWEKVEVLNGVFNQFDIPVAIAEFGGRRRHSVEAQDILLNILKDNLENFIGTSNVMFAKKYGLKPIGTMAHEWLQAHQALYRVGESQVMALEHWAQEYRGDLGIALSDVIGLKYFLHDFDMYFSKLFDGTRQDSGDPYEYGRALIRHYENMGIDPKSKTIVFSDGLTIAKAIDLARYFDGKIKHSYGIGTNLTKDFGFKPLQLVLKMIVCNGQPVAKNSDTPGKSMCTDQGYMQYLMSTFDRRISHA